MRRSAVLAAALLLLLATPVAAGKGGLSSCTINPNPVALGTNFTVTAQLQPFKAYDIRIDQDDHFGHHDEGWAFADENGLWTFTYDRWGDPRDDLQVGTFAVHIHPSSTFTKAERGSGGASCAGEVVP